MNGNEMKECPFCKETIKASATKCRYCKSDLGTIPGKPDGRDLPGRIIAGVAAYIARATGVSVSLVRVLFVVATIVVAPLAIGVYVAFWLIVPLRPDEQPALEKLVAETKRIYRRLSKQPELKENHAESKSTSTGLTEVNEHS